MFARATFDQYSGAEFAVSHSRLFKTLSRLPYQPLHKMFLGLTWLETWLRYPLKTLRIQDSLNETFAVLDPDGTRFGLTEEVRAGIRRNLFYHQVCDLVTFLFSLEKTDFRRRALAVENEDTLMQEMERGPGAIVAGFRIGAYPTVPWVLGSLGHRVTMIVGGNPLVETSRGLGETFIPNHTEHIRWVSARDPLALARSLESLNSGGIACTLVELSPIEFAKTTEVEFLGWKIQVPYGVPYLAAVTGRSIVPAIVTREDGPRFTLRLLEPLPPPDRDSRSIREGTQRLYGTLEEQVLSFPEQWIGWTLLNSHLGIDLKAGKTGVPAVS